MQTLGPCDRVTREPPRSCLQAPKLINAGTSLSRWSIRWPVVLRSWIVSVTGHAVGLFSLGLVTGGDVGQPSVDRPLLVSLVREGTDRSEIEHVLEIGTPPADDARTVQQFSFSYVGDTGVDLFEPTVGRASVAARSEPAAETREIGLAKEVEEQQPGGPPKNLGRSASFYGIEAQGSKFVFVVDMSGSMSGARFRRARSELHQSIEHLTPTQAFFVILFNDVANPMPSAGLASAGTDSVQQVDAWLQKIQCNGGTNPLPALMAALGLAPDAVFLLSDGKFDPVVAQAVAEFQSWQRIPIHTIGFASRKGESMLRAISRVTGGTYRYVH
ncbi:MAG TPA: VWA domain-containing protein [Pirellulales bacterium]|nr:VWA domain-containing protein [Pirellulales bacterium]